MNAAVLILRASALAKRYGPVTALGGVDFEIASGEVRALLGKNGAGKSTLVGILSGSIVPDQGEIELRGKRIRFSGPAQAQRSGIATVHQEFSLVPGLTVAENIMLGRWGHRWVGPLRVIDHGALESSAEGALERLGERLPLRRLVGKLSLAQQQVVEIAKAIAFDPDILILDEPTSALNAHEVERLLELVRRLARSGVAVIYVSHRMQEIPRVADSVTILRDGREVKTTQIAATSSEEIASLITGPTTREEALPSPADAAVPPDRPVRLAVRGLRQPGLLHGISFELHDGEVLGIAGVLGSGRTETLEAIYGVNPAASGTIELDGKPVRKRSPQRMLAAGVALAPEDRKRSGLVLGASVVQNLVMASPHRVRRLGVVSPRAERRLAGEQIDALAIAAGSPGAPASSLSGGNQQKLVFGKLLNADPRVLLLDEPTRGIDVQAKFQIYRLVRGLAARGVAVLFVSSELEEFRLVCDRVLVLNGGRIMAEFGSGEAGPDRLLAMAMTEEAA